MCVAASRSGATQALTCLGRSEVACGPLLPTHRRNVDANALSSEEAVLVGCHCAEACQQGVRRAGRVSL